MISNGTVTITVPDRLAYAESENGGESSTCSTLNKRALRAPAYAFILPNLEKYPDDFRRFLEKDMIEMATLRRLENSGGQSHVFYQSIMAKTQCIRQIRRDSCSFSQLHL